MNISLKTYTINATSKSFWDNFNIAGSADYYRPFFFRVLNWETVYDVSEEVETDEIK